MLVKIRIHGQRVHLFTRLVTNCKICSRPTQLIWFKIISIQNICLYFPNNNFYSLVRSSIVLKVKQNNEQTPP